MKFSEIPDYFVCQISTFSEAAKIVFPLSPAPNDRSLLARTVISFLFRGRINTGTPVEFGISLITMQEERERERVKGEREGEKEEEREGERERKAVHRYKTKTTSPSDKLGIITRPRTPWKSSSNLDKTALCSLLPATIEIHLASNGMESSETKEKGLLENPNLFVTIRPVAVRPTPLTNERFRQREIQRASIVTENNPASCTVQRVQKPYKGSWFVDTVMSYPERK